MQQSELTRLTNNLIETAWGIRSSDAELVPVFVLVTDDGAVEMVSAAWESPADKAAAAAAIVSRIAALGNVSAVFHVVDAYLSDNMACAPSQDPEATEALVAVGADTEGHSTFVTRRYGRSDDGRLFRRSNDQSDDRPAELVALGPMASVWAALRAA